ncbi:MAG: MCE family protein [Deltaproteobacteria bacterium]|nr:MCE family protein [Deltaproteobacteria bacterium]
MNSKGFTTEAKVGVFVLLTVLAIAYLTIRMNRGGFSLASSKTLYIDIDNASGILARTPVEFAGIRIGAVENVQLIDGKARIEIRVQGDVPVFQDSVISLKNKGILGEKVVTIQGGGKEPELKDGSSIQGLGGAGDLDRAIQNFNDVAQSIKDLIRGGNGQPSFKDIITNVNDITEDLRSVVRSNKSNLTNIVQNVQQVTTLLNNGDLKSIIENMKTTSETIKSFVSTANPQLRDVVSDFKNVMGKIDNTVESLNRIAAKVERGEGTLGKLLSDETTVNKVNDTLDGINDFVGRLRKIELSVGFRGEYLGSAGEMQSVASFKIQPSYDKYFLFEFTDGPLDFGSRSTTVTDITTTPPGSTYTKKEVRRTDSLNFTLLFARRFYDFTLKAGLIRSSGGFGAEYHLFRDRLSFGVDAFDFSRPEHAHVRIYAAAHLFKIMHFIGGVDDLITDTKKRNYFGGFGIMLTDNDLKSLLGIMPLSSVAK